MNISYNWLRELTPVTLAPHALAERLTMVGLAVEAVHEADDDFIFDIDLTSNRPDCLSHFGVAREVAVIEGGCAQAAESLVVLLNTQGRTEQLAAVEIRDVDLCPRYAARVVRNVKIAPSPAWLIKRLEAIGQRAINNVADITNYVLHELGQPLHAFDLDKLIEHRIVVRRAQRNEKIITLDGVERELETEMLVIADAQRPVAVAGVMGGADSEISTGTHDVLIESAYFLPASVRRTARLLGLHTEASHRFERGADYDAVLRAQARCVALICEIASGTATADAIDIYPKEIKPPVIRFRPERVAALTGLHVERNEMLRILTALGVRDGKGRTAFAKNERGSLIDDEARPAETGQALSFIAPSWRVDLEREEDLVEEVARHVGYDKIAAELPPSNMVGEYQSSEVKRRALRQALTAYGYDEAINFSFIDAAHDERFELVPEFVDATGDPARLVSLRNSIIENATRMRPSLLPGLLQAVRRNFNHGTRDVRLFETGRIFAARAEGASLPFEREALALVATGMQVEENRRGGTRELDFYDLKGALEAAIDAMNLHPLRFTSAHVRHLREGQAARVMLDDGTAVGTIGKLDEAVAALYKFRQRVYVAEVDLTALLMSEQISARYQPLPRYPSIIRDVTVLVAPRVTLAELLKAVRAQKIDYCRDAKLVGVYEGENIPEGKRAVTLRIEYRADERTLRDEEVDEMHRQVVAALENTSKAG